MESDELSSIRKRLHDLTNELSRIELINFLLEELSSQFKSFKAEFELSLGEIHKRLSSLEERVSALERR